MVFGKTSLEERANALMMVDKSSSRDKYSVLLVFFDARNVKLQIRRF